jgi:RHS repeat-associated protein
VALQSNELRHYDPSVGRWLDDEPIGYQPVADLYRYPVNRPE